MSADQNTPIYVAFDRPTTEKILMDAEECLRSAQGRVKNLKLSVQVLMAMIVALDNGAIPILDGNGKKIPR